MSYNEYILKPEGVWVRRYVQEDELNVSDSVLASFSENMPRTVNNAFLMEGWGMVSLSIGQSNYMTICVDRICLRSKWKLLEKEKILVPAFSSTSTEDVSLSPVWKIPPDMTLALMVKTEWQGGKVVYIESWLVALDKEQRQWRLPLPNLYENCVLCLGRETKKKTFSSLQDCLAQVLQWYERSQWNADLWDTVEQTQRMFQFKPEGREFVQQPPACKHWTELCKKVSLEIFSHIIV